MKRLQVKLGSLFALLVVFCLATANVASASDELPSWFAQPLGSAQFPFGLEVLSARCDSAGVFKTTPDKDELNKSIEASKSPEVYKRFISYMNSLDAVSEDVSDSDFWQSARALTLKVAAINVSRLDSYENDAAFKDRIVEAYATALAGQRNISFVAAHWDFERHAESTPAFGIDAIRYQPNDSLFEVSSTALELMQTPTVTIVPILRKEQRSFGFRLIRDFPTFSFDMSPLSVKADSDAARLAHPFIYVVIHGVITPEWNKELLKFSRLSISEEKVTGSLATDNELIPVTPISIEVRDICSNTTLSNLEIKESDLMPANPLADVLKFLKEKP
jgi:hypothetical protein